MSLGTVARFNMPWKIDLPKGRITMADEKEKGKIQTIGNRATHSYSSSYTRVEGTKQVQ